MKQTYRTFYKPNRERGMALLIALVFLVILTLLGITSMHRALLDEKMAGNTRSIAMARQAAEMALRDAERDIRAIKADSTACPAGTGSCRPTGWRPLTDYIGGAGLSYGDANCQGGQCIAGDTLEQWNTYYASNPRVWLVDTNWDPANWTNPSNSLGRAVMYGTFTGATALTGLYSQPAYLIEMFRKEYGGPEQYTFRITVKAWGPEQNTVVYLQEVFTDD